MIFITSNQTFQLVRAEAATTSELTYVASYIDESNIDYSLQGVGSFDGSSNGISAVTAVTSPVPGNTRRIATLFVFNKDTVASILTVQVIDGSNTRTVWKGLLLDGDTLTYEDIGGFYIINSSGEKRVAITNIGTTSSSSSSSVAAHATTHEAGGTDPIPLDTLAAPSDVTTLNVSSTKHGLSPKSPADATQFLNGAATPAYAQVKDSDLSTSDITTNNSSATKHGFLPKLSNSATDLLNGVGAWLATTSITAIGTIVTGVWNATKIGLAYGGTNADLSATGGTSQVLKQASTGAAITVGTLASSNLSDSSNIPLLNANNTFSANNKFATTQNFSWVAKSGNTAYQAASDGIFIGTYTTNGTGESVTVNSDTSNPPGTARTVGGGVGAPANFSISFCCPIRKGDFYEAVSSGIGAFTVGPFWVPLGTAG